MIMAVRKYGAENKRMRRKTNILIINGGPFDLSIPGVSRFYYLHKSLKKYFKSTFMLNFGNLETKKKKIDGVFFYESKKDIVNISLISKISKLFYYILSGLKTINFINENRINYCIIRSPILVFFIPYFKFRHIKIILDFHGYNYKVFPDRIFYRISEPFLTLCSDYILVVSEGVKTQLSEKNKQKVLNFPNGVDTKSFNRNLSETEREMMSNKYYIPENKKLVGFVGHNANWFRIEDLLKCAEYINSESHILIIGSGFNSFIKKYRKSNITFTGLISYEDVTKLVKLIKICVIPYNVEWWESNIYDYYYSRKMFEYLATGKPIIAADVKGRAIILKINENVLLYEPSNYRELANKIIFLLENEDIAIKMGENNKKLAGNFDWEQLLVNSGLIEVLEGTGNCRESAVKEHKMK